jgi:hypothetical protein
MGEDEDDTQAVADARETRDLVFSVALKAAAKAVAHVEAHDIGGVVMTDDLPAGGFTWHVEAHCRRDSSFVSVQGKPRSEQQVFGSLAEMAAVMGNESAAFSCTVPREWVLLAAEAAERRSDAVFGVAAEDAAPGEPVRIELSGTREVEEPR